MSRSTQGRLSVLLALSLGAWPGCSDDPLDATDGGAGSAGDATVRDSAAAGDAATHGATIPRPVRSRERHCRLEGTRADALPRGELVRLDGPPLAGAVALCASGDDAMLLARDDGTLERLHLDGDGHTLEQVGQLPHPVLALAPDPDHASNHQLFVLHAAAAEPPRSVLSRFTLDASGSALDASSEVVVLSVDHRDGPPPGGALLFAADGKLLVALGDGGELAQSYQDAANPERLAGKLLRLDVSSLDSLGRYQIPSDNPFASATDATRREIYALGLHDPRACVQAPDAGPVYCTDAGARVSELNRVEAGNDFGWPERDGDLCSATGQLCLDDRFARPVASYPHLEGRCAIRALGQQLADTPALLHGMLAHGDACDALLSGFGAADDGAQPKQGRLARGAGATRLLATGPAGELLRVDASGALERLALAADGAPGSFPEALSETGCYADLPRFVPATDLIYYDVRSPLWTDGAHKRRWLVVPDGATLQAPAEGPWEFPTGTILVKEFGFQFGAGRDSVRPVETRFMVKRAEGWEFHNYLWNDAGTDATLVSEDRLVDYTLDDVPGGRSIRYPLPGPGSCPICHAGAPGRPLGPRTEQLNFELAYDDGPDNQLEVLAALGLFDLPAGAALDTLPALPDPTDPSLPIEARARSYLHTNCAHCHQPGGWSSPDLTLDLRFSLPLAQTMTCGVDSQFYAPQELRVAPGDPQGSTLLRRMLDTGIDRMPPVATTRVDPLGTALVSAWIDSLERCP